MHGLEAGSCRQRESLVRRRSRLIVFCWLIVLIGLSAGTRVQGLAAEHPHPLPEFTPVQWLPTAASVLDQASLSSTGISLGQGHHRRGDTVTILAQIEERTRLRQWAIVLRREDLKPEEEKLRSPALTVYVSNGHKVTFDASKFTRVSIQVFGPFSPTNRSTRVKQITSETLVNPAFLGLGLDGTARLWRRLINDPRPAPRSTPRELSLDISSKPFSPEKIAEHQAALEGLAIVPAEERAYAGFLPAMMDFFNIARQTGGVRDIIFEVADLPWWSLLKQGGRIDDTHFEILGPFQKLPSHDWGLSDQVTVYSMGLVLRLEGKPTLAGRIAVTAPRPPLLNTAGIVGITAMRPDGQGPQLTFRVMAGRVGGARVSEWEIPRTPTHNAQTAGVPESHK